MKSIIVRIKNIIEVKLYGTDNLKAMFYQEEIDMIKILGVEVYNQLFIELLNEEINWGRV